LLFFFENNVLDADRRELRCAGKLQAIEPQVFDLLLFLIRNRDRVVSKDDLLAGVWDGRIVSDSTLASRINAARRAVGDSGEQQRVIHTIARKGFRFVGEVREGHMPIDMPAPVSARRPQEVRFCRTEDGVNLALASGGDGPPVIKAANWLTHIEYDWESPVWSPLLHRLAARCRLIRYDGRGTGLSDRAVTDISFAAFVRDLETVVESTGVKQSAFLGISQGAAVAISYAVRHPERVSKLVLYGGYAQGRVGRRGRDGAGLHRHHAAWMGRRAFGLHALVQLDLSSERLAGADQMVFGIAAHHDLGRECDPHPQRLRRYRRRGPAAASAGSDAGPALPA
jgi:DNA-binding winged helix-turn-helix (wHTH) protein/pimeloyl-ACP methyl ester carboxylesterase